MNPMSMLNAASCALLLAFVALPLQAASKEVIQLQTQLQTLQQQISRLQSSLDEQLHFTADVFSRDSLAASNLEHKLQELQLALQMENAHEAAQFTRSGDGVERMRAGISPIIAQLTKINQVPFPVTPLAAAPPSASVVPPPGPAATSSPPDSVSPSTRLAPAVNSSGTTQSQAAGETGGPPPDRPARSDSQGSSNVQSSGADVLYQSALEHYKEKDLEIALDELTKYLKLAPRSQDAIDAQLLLAEIEYHQEDYDGALDDYTAVSTLISDPAKAAHVQLMKGLCLAKVDRQPEAVLELQSLVERFPRSREAARAKPIIHQLQRQLSRPH